MPEAYGENKLAVFLGGLHIEMAVIISMLLCHIMPIVCRSLPLALLQDEKNQIITTNCWINQVTSCVYFILFVAANNCANYIAKLYVFNCPTCTSRSA